MIYKLFPSIRFLENRLFELLGVNSVSGSSEVKLGDSVLVVDDNNLVGVGKLSLKASASTATFFNRGLVSKYRLDS